MADDALNGSAIPLALDAEYGALWQPCCLSSRLMHADVADLDAIRLR